jgi:hypothetical protein
MKRMMGMNTADFENWKRNLINLLSQDGIQYIGEVAIFFILISELK